LFVHREASGIGDWIMAASVLKMCNQQYPQIHIDLSRNKTTSFIQDLMNSFDIQFQWVNTGPKDSTKNYKYRTGHLVYPSDFRNSNKHFIAGMVDVFNQNTGLALQYAPDVYAVVDKPLPALDLPKKYIVMPSVGRALNTKCIGKEWGYDNFNLLADLLSKHFDVVQIGSEADPRLNAASRGYCGEGALTVYSVLKHCQFFVGMVNGLCCLSGQHGIKSYIIYCGEIESPFHAAYPNQIPVPTRAVPPHEVYELICRKEGL